MMSQNTYTLLTLSTTLEFQKSHLLLDGIIIERFESENLIELLKLS